MSLQLAASHPVTEAAAPRALPEGAVPADTRLGPLRGEQGDFSFVPASSPLEWNERAQGVRRMLEVTLGLWPMPTKTPLRAVIHGTLDCGDYTVENVYFESIPGFFVTGNLYRPATGQGKRPGVLSPHGHFPGGRFQDQGREHVRRQIVQGAERFEDGGRSFMQSRSVQLARMGCVVFHYDMIGYADSVQIPLEVVHRFPRDRNSIESPPATGFYSASAEMQLQNVMGLQTYNSIRALDFLTSLPDVDPKRIAVTGASGGGTQTFMLCAVDDRPLVSVPAVIVSTTRQGGCTCEHVCGLRIGTYNLEFTALHAPKPLLLISADDATRTMSQHGFPEIERHYAALGAKDKVRHVALLQFPHNYNHVSRAAMYHWLNKHLGLGHQQPILERPYQRLTAQQLSVWDERHPLPAGGRDMEQRLCDWLTNDATSQLAALVPHDAASLARYRQVVGSAWDVLLRSRPGDIADLSFQSTKQTDRNGVRETLGLLRYRSIEAHQAELPVVVLAPPMRKRRSVVWIHPAGKSALYDERGLIGAPIQRLLDAGMTVLGADLFFQGEFLADNRPIQRTRWLEGEQAFASWTYCYNLPLLARRVHDVLALVNFARDHDSTDSQIDLVGLDGAGPCVAAALAQGQGIVTRAAIDTREFRFAQLADIYDINFLPGAVKYDDLAGLLALGAPVKLWLAGEGHDAPPIVRAAYGAAAKLEHLTVFPGAPGSRTNSAVEWLLK